MRNFAVAFAVLAMTSVASARDFAHVQTDKPQYRLGETIWYRIHQRTPIKGATVSLCRPDGTVAAKKTDADGSFPLTDDMPGGEWRLKVEASGELLHEIQVSVYDLVPRVLDLGLVVLGDLNEAGETVTATVSVRDLKGSPVEGARLAFRAAFGPLVVAGPASATDAEGRALIRFAIPADAQRTGTLSVGVDAGNKRTAAISRPVPLSSGISRIDAIPEGGAILPGYHQRFGLIARDLDGQPALCEGQVLDDKGAGVALFRTDRRGLASVDFKYEKDRTYRIELDRPSHVKTAFPMPGPTAHGYALRIEQQKELLCATVRGKKGEADLWIIRANKKPERRDIFIPADGGAASVQLRNGNEPIDVTRVVLAVKNKAILAAPVAGDVPRPVVVTITPRGTRALPGDTVTLDVTTRDASGHGYSCDLTLSAVNEGVTRTAPATDLPLRAYLARMTDLPCNDVAGLADGELDDYLLVHGALSFPEEGAAIPAKGDTLPEPARVRLPAVAARPAPAAPGGGKSVSKGTALDKLIERAPWTRVDVTRDTKEESFGSALVEETALPDVAPKGKLPQDVVSLRNDCRDTLLWRAKLTTDREGRATATFRISHEIAPLLVTAQGYELGGQAVGGAGRVQPSPSFSVKVPFPAHMSVGDTIESFLTVDVKDGEELPFHVRVVAPPCLRALDRMEIDFDPRLSARDQKFRFEVIAEAKEARLQVVSTRGAFRQVTTRVFTAGHRDIELATGTSACEKTGQTVAVKIPDDAVPGSVTVQARVATTAMPTSIASTAEEPLEKMLREPHGCFEQTTSSNYPNLVILETLRTRGSDPKTLERATVFARQGFERILQFQDGAGGFSLWDNKHDPQPHYTALAVLQLSQYARLFQGKGSFQMRKALAWLERRGSAVDPTMGLYVGFAAAEAGHVWPGLAPLLDRKPASSYEHALLANIAATWTGTWPAKTPQGKVLAGSLAALEHAQDGKTGAIASEGKGVMHSHGDGFTVETTALAALAFARTGKAAPAFATMHYLHGARTPWGGWGGTQATALAIRALAGWTPTTTPKPEAPVLIAFTANGRTFSAPVGERGRPLRVEKPLDAKPGSTVTLGLDFKTEDALSYGIGCRYRVSKPVSSKNAAYAIETSVPNQIVSGSDDAWIRVSLRKLAKVEGQVVAKIALPGGCEPTGDIEKAAGCASHEVADGYLVLYWETQPESQTFTIGLTGAAPGSYLTGPSVIYPYYQAGREAYAPGVETRVIGAYSLQGGGALLRGGK